MKKLFLIPLAAALAIFGTSCYSEHGSVHTKRSAVLGGIVGAGAGALIGEHNDRELEGAAVGGVLGAITGGVLGSARDESYHRHSYQRQSHRTYSDAPPYRTYRQPSGYHSSRSYGYGSYNSGYRTYCPPVRRTVYRSNSYCR